MIIIWKTAHPIYITKPMLIPTHKNKIISLCDKIENVVHTSCIQQKICSQYLTEHRQKGAKRLDLYDDFCNYFSLQISSGVKRI